MTTVLPQRTATNRALVGPPPAELQPARTARRRAERAVVRRALGYVDGVVLEEDANAPLTVPGDARRDGVHVLTVRDDRAWSAVARDGSAGLGEGYFRGWWHTDDLVGLLQVFIRSVGGLDQWRKRAHRITGPVVDPIRKVRRADPERDRRNVRAHYDLSNEFLPRSSTRP